MNDIFAKNENIFTENVSSNTRSRFYNSSNPKTVNYGLETLRSLGPKIWNMIPSDLKGIPSLLIFKKKIKKWIIHNCPCRLCKCYVPQMGYISQESTPTGRLLQSLIFYFMIYFSVTILKRV